MIFEMLKQVDYLHVLVAVLAYYFIGFLWYGPISPIGKIWMRETNTPADGGGRNMALIMAGTLGLTFLIVTAEAVMLSASPDVGWSLQLILLFGIGFVGGTTGMNYMYQGKSLTLFFIDFSYQLLGMITAGIILTVWR